VAVQRPRPPHPRAVCRTLYTLDTGEAASKLGALEWALRTVEPDRPPRPGEAEAARGFVASALTRAGG
jgi:hypothetical protein